MAFGQAAGPPAPQKQVDRLASLLAERGFDSFKEARHPFGLTQRQAGGKFTSTEVDELIERLEAEAVVAASLGDAASTPPEPSAHATGAAVPRSPASAARAAARNGARDASAVQRMDAAVLADELTSRGWCCIPPE
ncbi:MAG: hypothetical protein ACYC2O_02790 [Microthrixaceae bacterium]